MEFCGRLLYSYGQIQPMVYVLTPRSGWQKMVAVPEERCMMAPEKYDAMQPDSIMCLECAAKNGLEW